MLYSIIQRKAKSVAPKHIENNWIIKELYEELHHEDWIIILHQLKEGLSMSGKRHVR